MREKANDPLQRQAGSSSHMRRRCGARDRLPWLLAGLAGSGVATFVVASFEQVAQAPLEITFFIPATVYLADAVGTQTEAVAVRGISLTHAPAARLVAGEARTSALNALALGALAFLGVWPWFAEAKRAAAVGLAILVASATATTIGFALLHLLARSGGDPPFGRGPIATMARDAPSPLIDSASRTLLLR